MNSAGRREMKKKMDRAGTSTRAVSKPYPSLLNMISIIIVVVGFGSTDAESISMNHLNLSNCVQFDFSNNMMHCL